MREVLHVCMSLGYVLTIQCRFVAEDMEQGLSNEECCAGHYEGVLGNLSLQVGINSTARNSWRVVPKEDIKIPVSTCCMHQHMGMRAHGREDKPNSLLTRHLLKFKILITRTQSDKT